MNEHQEQIKTAFLKSRAAAVLRCAEIIAGTGKKDAARRVLAAAHIDRRQLEELKAQSNKGENYA